MADLTDLFAEVNILRYEKGSRGSHKIVKTCSFVCNDSYYIQLYFWCVLLINSAIPRCFVKIYIINSISLFIQ